MTIFTIRSRHRNGVDIGIHDFQTTSDMNAKSSTIPGSVDDVIMVNGTHMSEEMSARILQSLSQKVVFHSNNNANSNSTAASITTNRNVQPAPSNRITQTSTHRAIQPAPFKTAQTSRSYIEYANKSGPEYFRVKYAHLKFITRLLLYITKNVFCFIALLIFSRLRLHLWTIYL